MEEENWDEMIRTGSGFGESDTVVVKGDLNGHVGEHALRYEGVHGGLGFGSRA